MSDARRRLAGLRARANGAQFEARLEAVFARLAREGIALIEKTPEPMRPLSRPDGYGRFQACFVKKAQPDYSGVLAGGRAIKIEAKYTLSGRMEQGRVGEAQWKALDRALALGAACYVAVGFPNGGICWVPWAVWRGMKERFGRKHVTWEDLNGYTVPPELAGRKEK